MPTQRKRVKNRERNKFGRMESVIFTEPNLQFSGSISNITGGFELFEAGSVRRITRTVKRENFSAEYCSDIASLFSLNPGQQLLLKTMLENKDYFKVFKWDEVTRGKLATECELATDTTDHYFRSLVSLKKLIRKLKRGSYRMNTEFLFSPNEVEHADFLTINVSYVFEQDESDVVAIKGKKKVTIQDIQALIEIYQKQEKLTHQVEDMFPEETKNLG